MELNINEQIKRIVIVAYRLPFKVVEENNTKILQQNSGGLVSAMLAISEKIQTLYKNKISQKILWFGFSEQTKEEFEEVASQNNNFDIFPVSIPTEIQSLYYEGFCNDTIWPLFHYFPMFTVFDKQYFDAYKTANEIFCDTISKNILKSDFIWVHDYQLLLLPSLLRKTNSALTIGFFLHIPFPSHEIFKLLYKNWRNEIIDGLLGSDLIGFHTNDYTYNFLKTILRIAGFECTLKKIFTKDRIIKAETFPIGIDYDKYSNETNTLATKKYIDEIRPIIQDKKLIFSVDRLDYTKGLLTRLEGFKVFLEKYPEWQNKIVFNMVVVPSRETIPRYQAMRKEIEYLVSNINGKYGKLGWRPIVYQYKSLSFNELIALYSISHVGLVTPLRDGMNLVAKEYVACQKQYIGVLILSEMAGAAAELSEAIIVNPNDIEELAEAINTALLMPENERIERNTRMRKRISNYNVFSWAFDFINQLSEIKTEQKYLEMKILTSNQKDIIINDYKIAQKRVIFLDYDGTLVPFSNNPDAAIPNDESLEILNYLSGIPKNEVIIISGRSKDFLSNIFINSNINLIAEHGAFTKYKQGDWTINENIDTDFSWKNRIYPIFEKYTQRCYGSFVEMKEAAIVWHFRNSDSESAFQHSQELKEELNELIHHYKDLQLMEGAKIIEIKKVGYDKGTSIDMFLNQFPSDFIIAIGDDITDEYMFKALPKYAHSIKVGLSQTYAKYNLPSQQDIIEFLNQLSKYE